MSEPLAPAWLVRGAIAAVWLYEGLWCKLLRGEPNQFRIVEQVPGLGPRSAARLLHALGAVETALAVWALSGVSPVACALAQTGLLAALNANGLLWARGLIHDPGGMVVKNIAFLVLVWVGAGLPPWSAP